MRIFPLLLALALPAVGWAKDINGQFAVHGVGGEPCSEYQASRAAGGGRELEYEIWLSGYFSAFNQIVSNTFSIMGDRGLEHFLAALDEYCAAQPDALFIDAIAGIAMVVFPERQNLSPDVDRWPSLMEELGRGEERDPLESEPPFPEP